MASGTKINRSANFSNSALCSVNLSGRTTAAVAPFSKAETTYWVESSKSPLKQLFLYSGCDSAKNTSPAPTSRESIANELTTAASRAGLSAEASASINFIACSSFKFFLSTGAQDIPRLHEREALAKFWYYFNFIFSEL